MICFQISIFEPLKTTEVKKDKPWIRLWFAFKLVSLNHWKQLDTQEGGCIHVVICFQISIFEPLKTTITMCRGSRAAVVICFQISIFEPLKTTWSGSTPVPARLWFAFKLVSLNHWKQPATFLRSFNLRCDLLSN